MSNHTNYQQAEPSPRLPDDICRCHDEDCDRKEKCQRYTDPGSGDHVVHSDSLSDGDDCSYFILEAT